MPSFEAIVVGSGAMGSSIGYYLATRGVRTLTLEQFFLNHELGSSHGKSRIIRATYDHPAYIPLVRRATQLWSKLQEAAGRRIMMMTGGLFVGTAGSEITNCRISIAEAQHLRYEIITPQEIRERFPVFNPSQDEIGHYDLDAGVLFPENCIESFVELARRKGAEFHFNEPVLAWSAGGERVEVRTPRDSYSAEKLILAAGPWMAGLVKDLQLPLTSQRQVVFWFRPPTRGEAFLGSRMPVFSRSEKDGRIFYGIPDLGDGVKVALDHHGERVTPETIKRRVEEGDEQIVRGFLARYIPDANGQLLSAATCIYTDTPDWHFLIDFHPNHRNVILVSPCSGHGFKFSSVVGEIVAELVTLGATTHDISLFRLSRLMA